MTLPGNAQGKPALRKLPDKFWGVCGAIDHELYWKLMGLDPFTDDVFVAIINDRGRSYYGVVMPTIAYRRMYEHINRPAT